MPVLVSGNAAAFERFDLHFINGIAAEFELYTRNLVNAFLAQVPCQTSPSLQFVVDIALS